MIFYWILFILSIIFLRFNFKSGKILSPIFMLSLATFISIFSLIFGFLNYQNYLTQRNGLILLSFYFIFYLGSKFKSKKINFSKKNDYVFIQLKNFFEFSFSCLFLFIIIGIILQYNNIIFLANNFGSGNLISLARSQTIEIKNESIGIINAFNAISDSSFLIFSSIIFIPKIIKKQLPKYLIILSFISFICILLDTLAAGKRSFIIYSIIIGLILRFQIIYLTGNLKINFKKVFKFIFVGIISSYLVFGVFPTLRNPELTSSILNYVNDVEDREFSDFAIKNFVGSSNPLLNSFPAYIVGTSYLHTGFIKYNYFLSNNIENIDGYGLYNFNFAEKIIPTGVDSKYKEVSDKLRSISENDNFNVNPWASAFRDFIIDFGIFGSLIFIFIFSIICNNIYSSFFTKSINGKKLLISSYLSFFCFMLPFTSPIRIMVLGQTIFIIYLIYIFSKLKSNYV